MEDDDGGRREEGECSDEEAEVGVELYKPSGGETDAESPDKPDSFWSRQSHLDQHSLSITFHQRQLNDNPPFRNAPMNLADLNESAVTGAAEGVVQGKLPFVNVGNGARHTKGIYGRKLMPPPAVFMSSRETYAVPSLMGIRTGPPDHLKSLQQMGRGRSAVLSFAEASSGRPQSAEGRMYWPSRHSRGGCNTAATSSNTVPNNARDRTNKRRKQKKFCILSQVCLSYGCML